uniref:Uncharacterized protein n=1 Tax=Oryza brachyantha TaxID=4533 RepID=J3M5E8_ORYBR
MNVPRAKPAVLTLETVAHLGLLYFLFLVGLEMDVNVIRQPGKKALVITRSRHGAAVLHRHGDVVHLPAPGWPSCSPASTWCPLIRRVPEGETIGDVHVTLNLTDVMIAGVCTNAIGIHSVFGAFVYELVIPTPKRPAGRRAH